MIARIGPASPPWTTPAPISNVTAYRSPLIPVDQHQRPVACRPPAWHLPATVGTSLAQGRFLNAATAREPVAVLGAAAAQRLGIDRIYPGERIWVG